MSRQIFLLFEDFDETFISAHETQQGAFDAGAERAKHFLPGRRLHWYAEGIGWASRFERGSEPDAFWTVIPTEVLL